MSNEIGLQIEGVSHFYGRFQATCEVNLTIRRGEVHCLLGPSGSGKSTLLRLVAGLEMLQRGRIVIAGTEVAGPRVHVGPEKRSIGFVFQDYALFPHLNVARNVIFGMPRGSKAQKHAAADALLEQVGMAAYAAAMPHTLSGGQQQRVALARALARRPQVMLLDESFSGLDSRLREEVRQTTLDILRAADVATLMVTHDPQESLVAADVISVIHAGCIAQTGAPDEVYNHAVSRDVAEVFGPVNRLVGTVQDHCVATPCGVIPAPGYADGQQVDVLIRPESIQLYREPTAGAAAAATITALAPEGGTVRVALTLEDETLEGKTLEDETSEDEASADRVELTSRDLARRHWKVGDAVFVTFVAESAMVQGR